MDVIESIFFISESEIVLRTLHHYRKGNLLLFSETKIDFLFLLKKQTSNDATRLHALIIEWDGHECFFVQLICLKVMLIQHVLPKALKHSQYTHFQPHNLAFKKLKDKLYYEDIRVQFGFLISKLKNFLKFVSNFTYKKNIIFLCSQQKK